MTQLLPPKKEVALALLERSNVDIYLDPRAEGVVVPPQFKKEPRLILKIGLNMPVPIPDLRLDDESMSCTLSFNRSPFYCIVPWTSVFAMVGEDGRGMVWPDDVPQELAVRVVEENAKADKDASGEQLPPSSENPEKPKRGKRAPAVVKEVPAEGQSRPKSARGNGKKKKDERPVLVSVPAGPVAVKEPAPAAAKKSEGKPAPAPPPTPISRPPSNRPKRELPPYLRVVK